MVADTGCERIDREESVENKVFIHSLRKERGMVWRDTWALSGGGFYWVIVLLKNGGLWGIVTKHHSLFQCYLRLWL